MKKPDTIIIGGGIIGLSIGWRLLQAGQQVTIFDRAEAGKSASWQAGGMLAPSAEMGFEELELHQFARESLVRWEDFARQLEEESGASVDYRKEGTLVVADDRDSAEALRRTYDFKRLMEVPVEWLTGYEALELEPFLAPKLSAAVYSPEDHQVDNQLVVEALKLAIRKRGGGIREYSTVVRMEPDSSSPAVILADGDRVSAGCVVLSAGCWSKTIEGLPSGLRPPVRPVKGQMIELKIERPFGLRHVVRGPHAYMAPKTGGRIIIGATSEEMGFDTTVTAGGVYSLLEGAWEIVPGIYDLPLSATWAGLRPGTRDNEPLLGPSGAPGVFFATGHYRHGILHTPLTADEVSRLILTGETSKWMAPFSPQRFATSKTP